MLAFANIPKARDWVYTHASADCSMIAGNLKLYTVGKLVCSYIDQRTFRAVAGISDVEPEPTVRSLNWFEAWLTHNGGRQ